MPTIQEAILLLGPSVYWPLNTGDASGAVDLGLGAHSGNPSGSLDFEVPGAEDGTRALRVYAGGLISSIGMGVTTIAEFTLMAFISAPGLGTPNVSTPMFGIWDPGNRTARGVRMDQQSTGANNLSLLGRGQIGSVQMNAAQPIQSQHSVTWTQNIPANQGRIHIDGIMNSAGTSSLGANPVVGDPLQIKSDAPVVLSHVAWWPRALTQTEVNSVSSLRTIWPYDLPINTQPEIGGDVSGDLESIEAQLAALTGTQTAQSSTLEATKVVVDFIKGQWDGYQAVSLPSLGALLDGIKLDLQTTTEGAVGLISQSVGALLGFRLPSVLDAFDISGGSTGDQIDADLSLNFLYGLQLVIDAYPEDWKWRTPDHAWSLKDLATIRFFRGSDLVARFGVHTTSFNVEPIPGALAIVGGGITTAYWLPPESHVVVDFYPGVSGTLYEQRWP